MDDDLGPMRIAVHVDDGEVVVSMSGPVDEVSLPTLQRELATVARELSGDVDVDLAGVTFIGCSGLTVLADSRRELAASARALVIRRPSTAVVRALHLMAVAGASDLGELRPRAVRLGAGGMHPTHEERVAI